MTNKPRNTALIVAAGQGNRVGAELPKQFAAFRGMPMLRHSVIAFTQHSQITDIFVVIGADQDALAGPSITGLGTVHLVRGGVTRRESVLAGLRAIAAAGGTDHVLIHDAARPLLPKRVIGDLIAALSDFPGAVPALPVVDSLSRGDGVLTQSVDRLNLWRIQTPQAFHFGAIFSAHQTWDILLEATDDARMLMASGGAVTVVAGDEALAKVTFAADLIEETETPLPYSINVPHSNNMPAVRTGSGFDVHRLVEGEDLWLCGVLVPFAKGLAGHSDADVALHALTDAVLGALALGDIGDHFPPSDAAWRGASSDQFLKHAVSLAAQHDYAVASVDVTIICEAPKIGPHKLAMRQRLADILDIGLDCVSVKATTTEMLGFTGRGEGIAAQAIANMVRSTRHA